MAHSIRPLAAAVYSGSSSGTNALFSQWSWSSPLTSAPASISFSSASSGEEVSSAIGCHGCWPSSSSEESESERIGSGGGGGWVLGSKSTGGGSTGGTFCGCDCELLAGSVNVVLPATYLFIVCKGCGPLVVAGRPLWGHAILCGRARCDGRSFWLVS
jgi:hypothetical protein